MTKTTPAELADVRVIAGNDPTETPMFLGLRPGRHSDSAAERLLRSGRHPEGIEVRGFYVTNAWDRPVARACGFWAPRQTTGIGQSAIGFFEATEASAGRAVLAAAEEWLRERSGSRSIVVGPVDYTTWHGYRFMLGDQASVALPRIPGEPHHPASYARIWESAGYRTLAAYETRLVTAPAVVAERWRHAQDRARRLGFRIQWLDWGAGAAAAAAPPNGVRAGIEWLDRIHRVALAAFGDKTAFVPLGLADFLALHAAGPRSGVSTAAVGGEGDWSSSAGIFVNPAGADVGLAVVLQSDKSGLVGVKTLGLVPEWRSRGLGPALAAEAYDRIRAAERTAVLHCLMEAGGDATRMDRAAGRVVRRYALFAKPLA